MEDLATFNVFVRILSSLESREVFLTVNIGEEINSDNLPAARDLNLKANVIGYRE